jgi:hypothetical protein
LSPGIPKPRDCAGDQLLGFRSGNQDALVNIQLEIKESCRVKKILDRRAVGGALREFAEAFRGRRRNDCARFVQLVPSDLQQLSQQKLGIRKANQRGSAFQQPADGIAKCE